MPVRSHCSIFQVIATLFFLALYVFGFVSPAFAQNDDLYDEIGVEISQEVSQTRVILGFGFDRKPRYVMRPVAEILRLRKGSPFDLAGVEVGEKLIAVDNTIFTQIDGVKKELKGIVGGISDNLFTDMRILQADETTKTITVLHQMLAVPETEIDLRRKLDPTVVEFFHTGRLSNEASTLEQLSKVARALKLKDKHVSQALLTGAVNIHEDDFFKIFMELPGLTCEEYHQKYAEQLRGKHRKGVTSEARIQRDEDTIAYQAENLEYYCPSMAFSDLDRAEEWNSRFGDWPSQRDMPQWAPERRAERAKEFGAKYPTVASLVAQVGFAEYADLRCDFTYTVSTLVEDTKIECEERIPTSRRVELLKKLNHARASRDFGSGDQDLPWRIQLIADGSFDALRYIAEYDYNKYVRTSDPIGLSNLFGGLTRKINFETQEWRGLYGGLIALYGVMRLNWVGDCGDDLSTLTYATKFWTDYRNGFGHYKYSSSPTTRTDDRTILAKFAPIVENYRSARDLAPEEIEEMSVTMDELTCRSKKRRQLEDNMMAFIQGLPPIHVNKDLR